MGDKIATIYVADLPGHGASPLPSGVLFGELFLEDYTTVVLAVIDAVDPDVVIAHSMGAVIVQMAQERLAAFGTTLRAAYGVRGAVLLAPVIPLPIPWSFVDSGAAAGILGAFITFDPALGVHVYFPPPYWVAIFYANRSGGVAAGAPSPADALGNGWIAPESFFAGAQTVRLFAPPFVGASLFGADSGTVAGVVTMAQDAFFLQAEHRDLYVYLTGDDKLKFFAEVEGADAVHNVHTFNPAALVHPIKKVINAIDR
jgi:pimeloyl-ACP methyl ester carboxylesterase